MTIPDMPSSPSDLGSQPSAGATPAPLQPSGPTAPSVREEVKQFLEEDPTRLGDVYRWRNEGLSVQDMAERAGNRQHAHLYTYLQVVDAALDAKPVAGATVRRVVLTALGRMINRAREAQVSPEALRFLVGNRAAVENAAENQDPVIEAAAEKEEVEQAKRTLAELEGVAGIYAWSLGWYLEKPVDEARGTTFLKVGKADNIAARMRDHISGVRTHFPEPLALVRVYSTEDGRDLLAIERQFHRLLRAAGHENPREVRGKTGTEWFVTSTEFLDEIARALGMQVVFEGQSEFAEAV